MLLLRNIIISVLAIILIGGFSFWLSGLISRPLRWRYWKRLLGVIISLLIISAVFHFYVYHGFGFQADIYRSGNTRERIVAITFDDGPSPIYTPLILDILAEYGVPAAFFLVGDQVERYPEIALRIHEEGHEIGNHTYNHVHVPTTPSRRLSAEIMQTDLEILQATGIYPDYIRPPRGFYDDRFRRLAELFGHRIVLWSLSSQDWRGTATADGITRRVLNNVKPGDIILFHDSGALLNKEGGNRMNTVQALSGIIEGLWEKGYRIASLEEILETATPVQIERQEDYVY